ncbi:uncharacterized protein LOC124920910 [Impatiens glandulifera]|uniref:uncharacterized protein LOC124920910 n=1 Tax=Impatiens glandulifera TaxID=253017 RepID=UPI001FB0C25D|nr:uncharacterized protein LOC124920910 [Impatiens glandulifera]
MSSQSKGFWMTKNGGVGHLADGDAVYDNSSRIEQKRSHNWFADSTEAEVFPNKKQQVVQVPINKTTNGVLSASGPTWDSSCSYPSMPTPYSSRLFRAEASRPMNFAEQNISTITGDDSSLNKQGIGEQFGSDSCMGLTISHTVEDAEIYLSYSGLRKVKVNQVKDPGNGMSMGQAYNNHSNESIAMSVGQGYNKEDGNMMFVGPTTYNVQGDNMGPISSSSEKQDGNELVVVGEAYNNKGGEAASVSFGSFHEDIDALAQPMNGYHLLYDQSALQLSETTTTTTNKDLDLVSIPQVGKSRAETVSKSKSETKASRKEAPNSFPSNVRSLISTGMLDGVPVKYVSMLREELRGVIKGSGYLCGCQSCDYTKGLNAYEFERHAGCKTKHPNNHIYFENGKTIYQIVQELRSTPESQLFDAIQTVTGSQINQKAFRLWKESFQLATRELERIYGKEELNLK